MMLLCKKWSAFAKSTTMHSMACTAKAAVGPLQTSHLASGCEMSSESAKARKCHCRLCQHLASSECHPSLCTPFCAQTLPGPSIDSQSELSSTVRCACKWLLSK